MAVLDLLQAHRTVPYVPCTSRYGLFAIRIRSAPSVRKSAFGVKSCTKTYPKGHPPLYGSAFQALPTRGATTPLIVTAVLNSTRAALTRAMHSNRRLPDIVSLADFPLKRTLPCTAQPFRLRLQEELLNGRSPGERTDRAGLCKAHKARLCELERNPRQPTTNPQPVI